MRFSPSQFLHLAAGAALLPALSRLARAENYPTRPVRIVVPAPAGGTFDIVARVIAQWLSERLGQQFVIENRGGAGTNIGISAVAHSPADGYTLALIGSPAAINVTLYPNLDYNFARDIVPVASIESAPLIVAVNPAQEAKTVAELIGHAKANPGKINMGSGGIGSTGHVAGELFNMMAGIKMTNVPYRGEAPALTDLLGGQVQVVFTTARLGHAARQGRQAAGARRHQHHADGGAARRAGGGGMSARLRSDLVGGSRRTQQHAGRDRRQAQPGGQRRALPTPRSSRSSPPSGPT